MAKSKNRSWIQQHVKDPYVLQSQRDGYRSRASYKLLEIVEKNRLIRPGMTVVDLGSTPGGWSQVAARMVGHEGRVHALDILPMDPIAGVDFIQGDFTEQEIFGRDLFANNCTVCHSQGAHSVFGEIFTDPGGTTGIPFVELFPFIFMKSYINFRFVKYPSHDAQLKGLSAPTAHSKLLT